MLPFPLPTPGKCRVQVFTATHNGTAVWTTWNKLPCSFVSLTMIGGGGGGGGGFTAAAGSARGGGGGGGSSGILRAVWPSWMLPDTLLLAVGGGGAGGAAGAAGGAGGDSRLAMFNTTTAINHFAVCAGATNGSGGTGTGGGAGGSGGGAAAGNTAMGLNWAIFTASSGQTGGAGGAQTGAVGNAPNGNVGLQPQAPLSGGAGGGGVGTANTDFAGGPITGAGLFPTLSGGAAAAGKGPDGYIYQLNQSLLAIRELQPYAAVFGGVCYGGAGGGTAGASGTAGAGGRGGGWGTGGGGGGGGVTGGAGGKGGDGLVIIVCW
jgi:hypothetical protein